MSNTDENIESYLENRLKTVKQEYDRLKIIAIVLGAIALLLLGWILYSSFFGNNNQALSEEDLQKNPYIVELKDRIYQLNSQIVDLESNTAEGTVSSANGSLEGQVVYSVQIGAFEQKDLSLFSESFTNFKEIQQGGFNKYSIGNYENLEEAQELLKEIIAIGFRDAFIASYTNGERLKIEDAN